MPDTIATAHAALLSTWYGVHAHDRGLPWRHAAEPLARRALVEGLLAQTRAPQVALHYPSVFQGVAELGDWLALDEAHRRARVAPLGLPRLKESAVTSLARALTGLGWGDAAPRNLAGRLACEPGIGPYTAGMVGLLYGGDAAPVDCNVARVGRWADAEGDAERWVGEVCAAAAGLPSQTGPAPGYEVISAVLDVGQRYCRAHGGRRCDECPLGPACPGASAVGMQRSLFNMGF